MVGPLTYTRSHLRCTLRGRNLPIGGEHQFRGDSHTQCICLNPHTERMEDSNKRPVLNCLCSLSYADVLATRACLTSIKMKSCSSFGVGVTQVPTVSGFCWTSARSTCFGCLMRWHTPVVLVRSDAIQTYSCKVVIYERIIK